MQPKEDRKKEKVRTAKIVEPHPKDRTFPTIRTLLDTRLLLSLEQGSKDVIRRVGVLLLSSFDRTNSRI